jgi:hypothetical protein
VAVRFLRELPETWAKGKCGKGRAMLATALFDRIDVLGMREATVHFSAHAVRHGLAAVLPAGFGSPVSGRGERTGGPDNKRARGCTSTTTVPPVREDEDRVKAPPPPATAATGSSRR